MDSKARPRSRSRSPGGPRRRDRSHSRSRSRERRRGGGPGPGRWTEDRGGRRQPRRSHSRSRSRSPGHRERRRRDSRSRSRPRSPGRPRRRGSHSRSRSRSRSRDRRRGGRHDGRKGGKRGRSRSSSGSSSNSEDERRRRRRKEKHRKRSSRSRERKERKKEKKEKKKKGTSGMQWGKHGIISETDLYSKEAEFRSWLVEERMINPETISKDQTKKEFARFVEDYNTSTLPSDKYYNMEAYERRMAALRAGEYLPPTDTGYDPNADMRALESKNKRKEIERESYLSKEQLQELRKVQQERVQAGKMKLLGMDIKQNMGVRMDGTKFDD